MQAFENNITKRKNKAIINPSNTFWCTPYLPNKLLRLRNLTWKRMQGCKLVSLYPPFISRTNHRLY